PADGERPWLDGGARTPLGQQVATVVEYEDCPVIGADPDYRTVAGGTDRVRPLPGVEGPVYRAVPVNGPDAVVLACYEDDRAVVICGNIRDRVLCHVHLPVEYTGVRVGREPGAASRDDRGAV